MATKPTERILDWASTGSTTDPGGSKEAAGWLTSERPPANWWNWILNSFGKWLTYFETRTDERKWVAHLDLTVSPALIWSTGVLGLTGFTPVSDDLEIQLDGTITSNVDNAAIFITANNASEDGLIWKAYLSATDTIRLAAVNDDGTSFNIAGAGTTTQIYIMVIAP